MLVGSEKVFKRISNEYNVNISKDIDRNIKKDK